MRFMERVISFYLKRIVEIEEQDEGKREKMISTELEKLTADVRIVVSGTTQRNRITANVQHS